MLGRESSSFYLDDLSREENGWYLRGSIVHWFGGRGPRNMPFPAVQQDLVVDKSINPGIISIEQQTFKSVEECLSGGSSKGEATSSSGEWSVGMQSQMDVTLALPREKTFPWVDKPPVKKLVTELSWNPQFSVGWFNSARNCLASGVSEQLSSRN